MKPDDVFQFFGSVIKAAKAANISSAAFYKWIERGYIPFKQQKHFESITKGKLVAVKKDAVNPFLDEDNEKNPTTTYLPYFRYYDKKYGMCDVESIKFRKGKSPKITYFISNNKKDKCSTFSTNHLLQASILVDCTGKLLYEGDVCLLKHNNEKFIFENIEASNKLKSGKFKIIGNIFNDRK